MKLPDEIGIKVVCEPDFILVSIFEKLEDGTPQKIFEEAHRFFMTQEEFAYFSDPETEELSEVFCGDGEIFWTNNIFMTLGDIDTFGMHNVTFVSLIEEEDFVGVGKIVPFNLEHFRATTKFFNVARNDLPLNKVSKTFFYQLIPENMIHAKLYRLAVIDGKLTIEVC